MRDALSLILLAIVGGFGALMLALAVMDRVSGAVRRRRWRREREGASWT